MGRLFGRIFVGFTTCLICFIAYSSQIFIIWPWYGGEISVELLSLLIPFNVLVGMLLWNYTLCVTTDPGHVPASWAPDTQSGEGYEVKKLTGTPRYCRNCENYKPPRAHHCRQCEKCVLRMDHHCPWVNNCVGYFNYGHFIRFLFYVDLACSYHLVMVTRRVFAAMGPRSWYEPTSLELIFIVLNYTACIPVTLAVGGFSIYHFYCLLGNTTTIEGWEKDKVAHLVRRGKINEIKFPYHLGARRNIASVLGDNPWLWCWPTVPPGNGLKYALADGHGKWIELHRSGHDSDADRVWPPRDPSHSPYTGPQDMFTLPSSPWTYANDSLNPNLQPSNSRLRTANSSFRRRDSRRALAVPPYHPDYSESSYVDSHPISSTSSVSSDSEEYDDQYGNGRSPPRVRRGSEGYEVRPVDREEMLRRYIETQANDPERYQRYIPEPSSEEEVSDSGIGT
ncbi:hypothetical protein JAAARDRAFT_147325 [Jaapia argillacea MUCL 33604]|uniref:Palmitoyltransferase PFA4 n=1 Tax=Jaapia argillacea MUCL 33604 TaxID=933084 RepID=A0A067QKS9_9AGAM|nr:hypothetical protein JAAARDRAFT_147325 [Jaapia argillacea MUCL 33604]